MTIQPGNGARLFLRPQSPHGVKCPHKLYNKVVTVITVLQQAETDRSVYHDCVSLFCDGTTKKKGQKVVRNVLRGETHHLTVYSHLPTNVCFTSIDFK